MTTTGHALVDIRVTDDPKIVRLQAHDPHILRGVRIDMIHGVLDLMDHALQRIPALPPATLVLYGERDDIIPRAAGCAMFRRLADAPPGVDVRLYPDGYHHLTRDRQRGRTIANILASLAGAPPPAAAAGDRRPRSGTRSDARIAALTAPEPVTRHCRFLLCSRGNTL